MKCGTDVWNQRRKIPFVKGENPRVSLILPHFPPNWHLDLHNAFSMGVLKQFSGVVCGPIIAVHSSNDVPRCPPTPESQKRVKGGVANVSDLVRFGASNGNNSKMPKDMNFLTFKFSCS